MAKEAQEVVSVIPPDLFIGLVDSGGGVAGVIAAMLLGVTYYLRKFLNEINKDKIESFKGETEIDLIKTLRDEVERLRTEAAEDREANKRLIDDMKKEYLEEKEEMSAKIAGLQTLVDGLLEYQEEVKYKVEDAYNFVSNHDPECNTECARGVKMRLVEILQADVQ